MENADLVCDLAKQHSISDPISFISWYRLSLGYLLVISWYVEIIACFVEEEDRP
jgi:hypothetical protein